jgi:hypothetical protein
MSAASEIGRIFMNCPRHGKGGAIKHSRGRCDRSHCHPSYIM